jgi:hypothetical protein
VLVEPLEVRLRSDILPSLGEQTVGSTLYNGYGDQLALAARTTLDFTLSGQPAPASAAQFAPTPTAEATPAPAAANNSLQPVENAVTADVLTPVLIALIIILGGIGLWTVLRRRQTPKAD